MSQNKQAESDHVVIIGAGLAGIAMGIQLERLLGHKNFSIYDKDHRIGGTWSQNVYPNLSCDVASEYYSYSFFQNPDWSEKYASQPEILGYMENAVRYFHLEPHLHLSEECLSARWNEDDSVWQIEFQNTRSKRTHQIKARYLITAMGVLNMPKGLDEVPALKEYQGQIFHTSQWRDIDYDGKRVLVLGNGCSANQVVPWILRTQSPARLVQVARSAHWIAPKPNYQISGLMKWILRHVPFAMQIRRLWTAWQYDSGFSFFYATEGKSLRDQITVGLRKHITGLANPKYHNLLVPDYEFGAKRPIADHGYLEATNNPCFSLIQSDGLKAVEGSDRKTLVTQSGESYETDTVILANGFKSQDLLTPMNIIGLDNRSLRELWQSRGGAEAYMGTSINGFPNFFMLAGPNTLPSNNSTLQGIESTIVYITRLLRPCLRKTWADSTRPVAIMPTVKAEKEFNDMIQTKIEQLVYTKEVSTWYLDSRSGKNTLNWPGTQFAFWWSRCMRPVRWSDWSGF